MKWLMGALAAVSFLPFGLSIAQAATLLGDTVNYERYSVLGPGSPYSQLLGVSVSSGVEFVDFNNPNTIALIDVQESSIRFSPTVEFSCAVQMPPATSCGQYMRVYDLNWVGEPDRVIVGINVTFSDNISLDAPAPGGWNVQPAFSIANVFFDLQEVRLQVGGYIFPQGSFVQVDLVTAMPNVPLPAALPLLAAGLGAMGFMGWRRRRKPAAVD